MHKIEKIKYVLLGCLASTLIFGVSSVSAGTAKQISAIYSNIKIYVDGILIEPKDQNGNKIEPFIYNGTTYLPVRAISEALDKKVKWDGAAQSVYIGTYPGEISYLLDVVPPYHNECRLYAAGKGETFSMGGKDYSNGFVMSGYGNEEIDFNLNGQYSEITGMLGCIKWQYTISRHFDIYLDGELYKSIDVKIGELPKEIKIPVNGVLQLKIVSPYNSYAGTNGDTYIGFGDIRIK